ncbi:NUDIX domain-containing protein [Cronobacter turicensis]|uniref:NUDIX domain-containing protein n=1 Tax=Cronobacter turicensis TaxID=413502 RepID=UPI0024C3D075|nr:NUDIX domain-containing protein [Cronobacter turicensis]MDK1182840.1 NUDIX domain-containing protein [Cronobacter turicensis]MDK1204094.1 NUDIX domain-containing protein [Cronobacter turicensis]MDK1215911.1 NUDIX domain-containing protein [Cronobacter turicensis]MDK1220812.1 NUDIX domain-containing protein [Cronobacter turicensis]MDK1232721.1 NUDIX domain-containing protein [Cronobacter turicensis]
MPSVREKVRIIETQTLSDDWYVLKKYTFDYQRRDGQWQRQSREAYDRGNGATILLYNRAERCVILTRQFRLPVFLNGYNALLTETAAGLLDEADPETRIRAEAEEETGYLVDNVEKVFEAYMSPGSVTEKLYFFIGEYDPARRSGTGGGVADEGEDIDVVKMPIDDALRAVRDGEIVDAKTIMLLQYAALNAIV